MLPVMEETETARVADHAAGFLEVLDAERTRLEAQDRLSDTGHSEAMQCWWQG